MAIPVYSTDNRIDIRLNPCDTEFINYCISEITEDGMLPFTIPPQALIRIIRDSALWFYRECEEATEEKWLGIRLKDLHLDMSRNKEIRLPDNIETVMDIKQVSSTQGFKNLARFLREPIMFSSAYNMLGSGGSAMTGLGNPYRMADRDAAFEEAFVRVYEYSLLKTLLLKGIRFDFNPHSKVLNFLGKVTTDIVIDTLVRIPLQSLYNDIRFRQYVVGKAMIKLKKILNMFDFQYPGEVKINFDDIEAQGKELVEKLEEEIKSESNASDIILMK